MRKYFYILFLFIATLSAKAQPYGNEWINYGNTYYKFKVLNKGICRINAVVLSNAGIPTESLIGSYFKLFRNGQEVPIYVSNEGQFTTTDFIEFLGEGNDGIVDTYLYANSNHQPHTSKSMFQDSATYFLTIDPFSINQRLIQKTNDLPSSLSKEPYGYRTLTKFATTLVNGIPAYPEIGNYNDVFTSDFGNGEGFGGNISGGFSQATTNLYSTDTTLKAKVKLNYFTNVYVNHDALIKIGSTFTQNDVFNGIGVRKLNYDVPIKSLTNNNTTITITPQLGGEGTYTSLFSEITYPATFNAGNASTYTFGLNKVDEVYIEIPGFNTLSSNPIMYDLSNKHRYILNNESPLKIHLDATPLLKDNFYISAQNAASITNIVSVTEVKFENFLNTAKQGNFLIITRPDIQQTSDGAASIEEYRSYRSSMAGGNYVARVYLIDQLDDQFGYGIVHHPLAIRNFINFAIDNFSIKPQQLFILGRGRDFKTLRNNSGISIQTYGFPPSDNLLVARSGLQNTPQIGVGRLDVNNGTQILNYLNKVREFESSLNDTLPVSQTPQNKLWRKNVLHLGGGYSELEQIIFKSYLDSYKATIEAPKYGASVKSLFKNSSNPIQIAETVFVDSLVNSGVSLITFFGHASTTRVDFDLEPERFNNKGKYPLFFTNGCFVGNIFSGINGYSDRYVLTPDKAAIGFLGPYDISYANILHNYSVQFYNKLSFDNYNDPIGTVLKEAAARVIGMPNTPLDPSIGAQMIYHGDPAIRLNTFSKPDFYIDASSISFEPNSPSIANDSFAVQVIIKNLGAAQTNCTYSVRVDRILPNGARESFAKRFNCATLIDTVQVFVKNDRSNGAGINTFTIKVDADNEINEYSELNNEVTVTKTIASNEIIPIFPYEFCIVNDPNFILKFNTAYAFVGNRQYRFEIDTTEFFNSPILVSQTVVAPGSVIDWKPSIPLLQDKVYYWRGSLDTIYNNELHWNGSSFLYNTSLSTGWNQSHYFQYLKDKFNTLELPGITRKFQYPNTFRNLKIKNGIISDQSIEAYFDEFLIARNSCNRASMIFFVFDVNTGKNLETFQIGNTGKGPYGDRVCVGHGYSVGVIEFPTRGSDANAIFEYRQKCIEFLNNIPNNAYVMGYSFYNAGYSQWNSDISMGGQSLFDALENLGVTEIRNQEDNVPFVFFLQKGNPFFTPVQIKRPSSQGIIDTTFIFSGNWNNGTLQSTVIGPAKAWTDLHFNWSSLEQPVTDISMVDVVGIDTLGTRRDLFQSINTPITDLTSIDAKQYPFLQLEWNTSDHINTTAPQLNYWRITHAKAPEGVINPSVHFNKSADSVILGGTVTASIAFQNITPVDMDSVLVKFTVISPTNVAQSYYKRFATLPGNSHIIIDFSYQFEGNLYTGLNKVIIEANPDNDQLEQFHFNNFAEFFVYVIGDNINPLLDVTFDGKHITDGEYISAKPEILFRLKDENKTLALNDTSAFLIYLYYPNNPNLPVLISNSNPDVTFIPADPNNLNKINEARLVFKPTLADGNYEIRVQGIDRSNNDAGKYEYRIKFKVDSKPSISNFLNYPNPFSTSTQFVFTITGSEVPDNILIQIFSQSGKVVKEITQDELGKLHIGINVTDYKWNATDNYGDRLANGVYFYRVIVKDQNGKNMEIKSSGADKYFKNGYGKMYIIK